MNKLSSATVKGAIGGDGLNWPQTMDADVWATEFIEHMEEFKIDPTDHDLMLGWFANCSMAGYDLATSRAEKLARDRKLWRRIGNFIKSIVHRVFPE